MRSSTSFVNFISSRWLCFVFFFPKMFSGARLQHKGSDPPLSERFGRQINKATQFHLHCFNGRVVGGFAYININWWIILFGLKKVKSLATGLVHYGEDRERSSKSKKTIACFSLPMLIKIISTDPYDWLMMRCWEAMLIASVVTDNWTLWWNNERGNELDFGTEIWKDCRYRQI